MPPTLLNRLPLLTSILLAGFFALTVARGQSDTTLLLIASSVIMFACCWSSAIHLLGARPALYFVIIAVLFGWFAEETGARFGWFFGQYTYTDVLGPRIGAVPAIIPLMWFALTYSSYVIANLIVWQDPAHNSSGLFWCAAMAVLAAMIVTAYDLGADPYMVFVLKAWLMTKTDGWWFTETLQGFVGWFTVAFAIVFAFHLCVRRRVLRPAVAISRWQVLVPLAVYGGSMLFQMAAGHPVETRTVALFAMGIPLLCAGFGWARWQAGASGPAGQEARA